VKKRAETPQVRSSCAKVKKVVKKKNWTSVKSKIDTGRKIVKTNDDRVIKGKKCGIKRRLFDGDAEEKQVRSSSQPPSKKRRVSAQPIKSTKTNGLKNRKWN